VSRKVALVDEARCIGCTRCIDACPVDAIVGAQGFMHTVVEEWCIGSVRPASAVASASSG
jgi:electron transport complex protein RnfB